MLNIYEMYDFYGRKPGFWVRRTTWGNTIAKITHVDEATGAAPYYDNPKVLADVFDIHSGRLKESGFEIDTAGTFKTWRWVQPPEWSGEENFDPRAGRIVLNVPFEKNEDARKLGAKWSDILKAWWLPEDEGLARKAKELGLCEPIAERVFFQIPYQDRHLARAAHARWEKAKKLWSLPEDAHEGISLLREAGYAPIEVE